MQGSSVLPLGNHTVNHTVCKVCGPLYDEVNKHYVYMEEKFDRHVCMDVVDTVSFLCLLVNASLGVRLL